MNAVIRREVASRFHALSTWVFLSVTLLLGGAFCSFFHLLLEDSHFRYSLEYLQIVMVIALPLLTMGAFASPNEKGARRLLASLPLTAWQTVLGKYLSYLAVIGVMCAVLAVYPLILSAFGPIAMATTYAALFVFFLLCAALLAICLWIASLCREYGRAASAIFGVVALIVAYLPEVISLLLMSVGACASVTSLFRALSLSVRFVWFGDGIFDMTSIVFYLSVIALFLCLTWVSAEHARRRRCL